MNGEQLRDARIELRWTRQQLADRAGLKLSQVAVIEQGRRSARPEEVEALQGIIRQELGRTLVETGEHAVIDAESPRDDEARRTAEWRGVRRGEQVKLRDHRGTFTFLYHHVDPTQEYVQLFGPTPHGRNPRAPQQRSVAPDRVVLPRRRER